MVIQNFLPVLIIRAEENVAPQILRSEINVFDKLIWRTIDPKSFLFALHSWLLGLMLQLIMIILSLTAFFVNWLKMYPQWCKH